MKAVKTPSAQYSVTMRIECPHRPGWIARIARAIAHQGGAIRAIDLVNIHAGRSLRDYTVECASAEDEQNMLKAIRKIEGVAVHSVSDDTFLAHLGGKLEVRSRHALKTRADLSMVYTPGVARVCQAIERDRRTSFNLTIRKNCIAVISDGSAVLGLGNIGAAAALPVMEGKAVLFKEFGEVDAFPLCIDDQEPEKIIDFCRMAAPSFGGINLEDISAPRCFEIERRLNEILDIPVFHDDQHGTAVVVLAALINALKITGREATALRTVISGAGAAGSACARILLNYGVRDLVVCDRKGAIYEGRDVEGNPEKEWLAGNSNPERRKGSLKQVLRGSHFLIGLSSGGILSRREIQSMAPEPILFVMANPTPEVMPEEVEDLAAVIGTGRSDYPNQINNVLAFPGIFRGALDTRASDINEEMKAAAAQALAAVVPEQELSPDYIIPSVFNRKVRYQVAKAVARTAHRTGVAHRMPKGFQIRL